MDAVLAKWNPSWDSMPWKTFSSPAERFQVLPSFVIAEFVFLGLSLILLIHACKQGRIHLLVWALSIITGAANDAIFMALPLVDNFWQAQACIMLTPRMPLYIPCVYNVFMYTSVVAAWRFGLPPLAEAALTGLMGEMIYAPYDISGAKFIWWTWHDSDAPIRHRILGVPIGSSAWVITFTATFQFLIRRFILGNSGSSSRTSGQIFRGVLLNILLTTVLMMVQMSLAQLISGDTQGLPTANSLLAVLAVYLSTVAFGFYTRDTKKDSSKWCNDRLPKTSLYFYYLFLTLNMVLTSPETHVSTGVHQTIGPCDVKAIDLSGQERFVYRCSSTRSFEWNLDCGNKDYEKSHDWYTLCGKPHSNYPLWVSVTAALCAMGTVVYGVAFSGSSSKEMKKQKKT